MQQPINGWTEDLVAFFKAARHLWGRCPSCGSLFRLSDAAISSSPEPPRDWLRRLERQQATLLDKEGELDTREPDLNNRERDVGKGGKGGEPELRGSLRPSSKEEKRALPELRQFRKMSTARRLCG